VPEICKKSLDTCSVIGGRELFIIGKNFLKDTKVTFLRFDDSRQPKKLWEETVQPDKEYLQQTHLICVVPPYPNGDSVMEPIHVQIYVTSSNKKSEAHNFIYTPLKKSRSVPQSPVSSSLDGGLMFSNSQESNVTVQQQHMVQNVLSIAWNEPQVTSVDNMMPPPLIMPRKSSFSKNLPDTSPTESPITLKTEFIDQTQHPAINGEQQQDVTTSSVAGLQPSVPDSVKEMMFGNGGMIDVTRMQNPYVTQDAQALMASSQVHNIFEGFKLQSNDGSLELHHIKSEQITEQSSSSPTAMLPPPPPTQELNSAQQQQVVENFLNLIVQSTVMNEPLVVTQNSTHHHMTQDIILNSASNVSTSSNVVIQNELVNSSPNMILNSAMVCEPNMMSVQLAQDGMNSLGQPIENSSASSIVSNAVSDATAETQAVVKQMIAQAAAEMLSENASETQSTISNFISNIMPAPEQQQIPSPQQLQEMLVQELNVATSNLMQENVKKEEANV
jgi:nuclear factor of activated T-cells 5